MDPTRNPKNNPKYPFTGTRSPEGGKFDPLMSIRDLLSRWIERNVQKGAKVGELPRHLFAPPGAKPIDIKEAWTVLAGTQQTIMTFTAPQNALTVFTHYAVFNDGLLAANFDFIPTINNRRIYSLQGDPDDNFRIYLGNGPDLGNQSLNAAYIEMQPGQQLQWVFDNRDIVDVNVGVRMVGFLDQTLITQNNFGG